MTTDRSKKVILVVIDGLTPSMFEAAVGDGRFPALSFLAEQGRYSRAVSTFPSLTPVCVSSIATGAHPDVHHIPHLVWYDREHEPRGESRARACEEALEQDPDCHAEPGADTDPVPATHLRPV